MSSFFQSSKRVSRTLNPIVVSMNRLIRRSNLKVLPLSQGQVYWTPPESAFKKAETSMRLPAISRYGPDEGSLELRNLLESKISRKAPVMVSS